MAVSKKSIMNRYFFAVLFLCLLGMAVVVRAGFIMFAERDYWEEVASRFTNDSVVSTPIRGNILASDGRIMVTSLPTYRIYMDFKAGGDTKDSLLLAHIDEICEGLHRIFPSKSTEAFKRDMLQARREEKQHYAIYSSRISYLQCQEVSRLPVFNLGRYRGGFTAEELNSREKLFGSLASSTLGSLYADPAKGAIDGLELAYDSLLRGQTGLDHRQKVQNRWISIPELPAVNGCDLLTTIDVDMQDVCEKALRDKLEELETLGTASVGTAILMEVATGDVKAMVNLVRRDDGSFRELGRFAISALIEPGSTFKTASLMVALEDGYITPETLVDTEGGQVKMYGNRMTDHNHRGFGVITATRALEVSSNVGVSKLIDKYYASQPQKFVDGLRRMGVGIPLGLELRGSATPRVKQPGDKDFSRASVPWMSIGYETQIPPISTITFYNAIANDGVMVRPRFVKAALRDGEVVQEFPTKVLVPKICSDKTLSDIRMMLRSVVANGLAKDAACKEFHTSGKTGTAQVSQGAAGYRTGRTNYLVSFCGYFPSEAPRYTCIVAIQKSGLPASGGKMAGSVFSKIAERVCYMGLYRNVTEAADSSSVFVPTVKAGNLREALYVLDRLDVNVTGRNSGLTADTWGSLTSTDEAVSVEVTSLPASLMPNVIGMGAKDAVYLLERMGLRVHLSGVGRVTSQSVPEGLHVSRGQSVGLILKK